VKFTKATMFPRRAKFGPALVLALVACSVTYAQDVRTNHMPGTESSKFHTYAWVNDVQGVPAVGGHPDQILDAQVKEAIDAQMVAKGFTKVENGSKADLLLGYQIAIHQEKQINGFGDNSGGWGGAAGAHGVAASGHFRPVLQAITSVLSLLVCMTLLQGSSFG